MYHVCTNSLMMIAMKAYSCRSTSLLLVKGGRISSIGAGVLRPLSPSCEHNVLRIKKSVERSDAGSEEAGRVRERGVIFSDVEGDFWVDAGVGATLFVVGFAEADCEDIFKVEMAFDRG